MERKWLMSIEIVILSGASRSFIARGAVEEPVLSAAEGTCCLLAQTIASALFSPF
jgi:hypothetical protein